MKTTYPLYPHEIKQARDFAEAMRRRMAQSPRDFGTTSNRGATDFIADTAEGKLAELVFAKFIREFAWFDIGLDFGIYDNPSWSDYGQDIDTLELCGETFMSRSRVDIKATRWRSQWLLVERHKFWADAYIMVRLDLPPNLESDLTGLDKKVLTGNVTGFAYYFDFVDAETKRPWFPFRQGESLFNPSILRRIDKNPNCSPQRLAQWLSEKRASRELKLLNVKLKARENYGLPIRWLRREPRDWNQFSQWLHSSIISSRD